MHMFVNLCALLDYSYFAIKICQLKQQQMSSNEAHKPVNMAKLKKSIDNKIEAILKYLQNDQNFIEGHYEKETLSIAETKEIESNSNIRQSETQEFDSLVLNIRQTDAKVQQRSKSDRASIGDNRQSTALDSVEQQSCETSQTPSKLKPVQNKPIADHPDCFSSSSKENNKEESILRVLGVSLAENNKVGKETETEPFLIEDRQRSSSKSQTKRSKSKLSYEKRNKENDCCSPTIEEKFKLKRAQFSSYSSTRRIFESFSGIQRVPKVIPLGMIERLKEEVEELYKKTRREAQDNNARARLLKRVQNYKVKIGEFMNS